MVGKRHQMWWGAMSPTGFWPACCSDRVCYMMGLRQYAGRPPSPNGANCSS